MAEPATAPSSETARAVELLGGKRVLGDQPRTDFELIAIVRDGLPFAAFKAALASFGLSMQDVEERLQLSARSLHRRREGRLSPVESERVLRLVRVAVRAERVLGDLSAAIDWLSSPNRTLAGERPIALLDTDLGAEQVFQLLGRIEFGVYA